jgi:MoaA/NifB/PqqE/SkfB family radical SAM enzyme
VRDRPELYHAKERNPEVWERAIWRDKIELVDIAGGEPLLLPWIGSLIESCSYTAFGLSTNGLAYKEITRLCRLKPYNLVSINVSYHPDAARQRENYDAQWRLGVTALVEAGFTTHTNVVAYDDNSTAAAPIMAWLREQGIPCVVSPYEHMDVLGDKVAQGLCCQGGVNHMTVAPDGMAWPCLTTLRSPYWRETALGNWLDGAVDLERKEQPCHLRCVDYYVLQEQHSSGDMWHIEATPCD